MRTAGHAIESRRGSEVRDIGSTQLLNHGPILYRSMVQELCESRGRRPNESSGFRGRKELLNRASALVTTCP